MLSKRPEVRNYDLSSVREITSGGAPLKVDLQNEVSRRFNVNIIQGWGMTELTCSASSLAQGAKDETGSCGLLAPNCYAKFLDESGNEVGPDTPGELFVKGPNVMLGYWRNEAATKETLDADGWLKTGDVAVYNKEGLMWIVDRKKALSPQRRIQKPVANTNTGAHQGQWPPGRSRRARISAPRQRARRRRRRCRNHSVSLYLTSNLPSTEKWQN